MTGTMSRLGTLSVVRKRRIQPVSSVVYVPVFLSYTSSARMNRHVYCVRCRSFRAERKASRKAPISSRLLGIHARYLIVFSGMCSAGSNTAVSASSRTCVRGSLFGPCLSPPVSRSRELRAAREPVAAAHCSAAASIVRISTEASQYSSAPSSALAL